MTLKQNRHIWEGSKNLKNNQKSSAFVFYGCITNYSKPNDLKQHLFIISQFCS